MTDEEQVQQALAELWDIVKCRCNEAYTGRGLHDPDCECDRADAVRTVADAITTLRAQLAEAHKDGFQLAAWQCLFEDGKTGIVCDDWGNQYCAMQRRADRAEAALAAPEVMHEDAPAAIIGEIGNQIHNLGCELQNDEDVSLRLSDLACRLWDAAKLFPTEPTALDRHDAKTREKALREAADELRGQGYGAAVRAILALIEEPNAR